jgi:membrane protease YdiL (CAAX protease family)
MSDPTEPVIIASFAAAAGAFLVAAASRNLSRDEAPHQEIQQPAADISPYVAPAALPVSPEETTKSSTHGKVPTWFFRPLDLAGIGILVMFYAALVIASLRMIGEGNAELDPGALISTIGFQFISAGIVSAAVIPRVRATEWLGLKWNRWPTIFLVAPGCVVGMWLFFYSLQTTGYIQWLESLGVDGVQDTVKVLQQSTDPLTLWLMVAAAVVAAPLCEEIVFRGYLYGAAKRFAGPWVAGFFSALVFASVHGSLVALLPLFVFGCLLAFVYEKTGSIWAPIAIHFCFNGATVLVQMAIRFGHLPTDSPL